MGVDANRLRALIAGGETLGVEFKSDRTRLSDGPLVEAVACMANGGGGVVLLGVEDDGSVTGARPRHGSTTAPGLLQALIANTTVPPLDSAVTVAVLEGKEVVAIEVDPSPTPIGTSAGVFTRRAMRTDGRPECVPYAFHEMFSRVVDAGRADYARTVVHGARWADLDPLEFERVRALCAAGGDATLAALEDAELARALGVVGPEDSLTVGALLVFGRADALASYVPTHEVLFQVLRGTAVEASVRMTAPLIAVAEDVQARLSAYNREQEFDAGLVRIGIPLISPVAIREVVANALVHREYSRLGAIQITLDDDALTVSSPGGLPEGITTENFLRENRPRSPLLAEAFKRVGLVERSGRGINRIFAATLRLGRGAPDYARTGPYSVVATFALGTADLEMARFVVERERTSGRPFPLDDLQVLARLRDSGSLRLGEAAELLQRTEGDTRVVLARMVSDGLVEQRGSGRGTRYHLAATVYRALGEHAAYVRVHGFADLQAESMVLAYADAHGRITRAETASLCSITPDQASGLLRRLAREARLTMHGTRRGAYYTLPSSGGN